MARVARDAPQIKNKGETKLFHSRKKFLTGGCEDRGMARPQPVPFGRRGAAPPAHASVAAPSPAPTETAAFFAAVRAEMQAEEATRPLEVRRSKTAALIAGLVTGCALAGFNLAGPNGTPHVTLPRGLPQVEIQSPQLALAFIVLSLLGAARVTAFSIFIAHWIAKRLRRTDTLSYALGGGAVAAVSGGLFWLLLGMSPDHGWAVEILSGAGAAALYRILAGVRPTSA